MEVIGEEGTYDHYTPPVAPSTTLLVTRGACFLVGAGVAVNDGECIGLDAPNQLKGLCLYCQGS